MPDTPDAEYAEYGPEDLITFPDGRMPVYKEDYDIEMALFSKLHTHGISARTGEEIPAHFLSVFYNPKYSHCRWHLERVAREKAIKVCRRYYSQSAIRDMADLYDAAEEAFTTWWAHLEDEEDASEVDEDEAMRLYINKFIDAYPGELFRLDSKHPENRREHHDLVDQRVAYLKEHEEHRIRSYQDYSSYWSTKPRWQQNVAADGRESGVEAAEEDAEIGMGFRQGRDLEKLAGERFETLWHSLALQTYFDNQHMFDFLGLRAIFVRNFMNTYAEHSGGGQQSAQPHGVGARVVTSHRDQDARVYLIEINDPQHLAAPVQVEIAVQDEGAVEMHSGRGDDG